MNITIIEDDKDFAYFTAQKLKKSGFSYKIFNSYNEFKSNNYYNSDLFIIDLDLGDGSGLDIIKYIKQEKKSMSPILISSGTSDVDIKVKSFEYGADDYIVKPTPPKELIARIKSLIRRSYKVTYNKKLVYKGFIFDTSTKILTRYGKKIKLSFNELGLLEFLLLNVGQMKTKEDFINSVWGEYDYSLVTDNTINVTISRLRKKLGSTFKFKTISGIGYILEK